MDAAKRNVRNRMDDSGQALFVPGGSGGPASPFLEFVPDQCRRSQDRGIDFPLQSGRNEPDFSPENIEERRFHVSLRRLKDQIARRGETSEQDDSGRTRMENGVRKLSAQNL